MMTLENRDFDKFFKDILRDMFFFLQNMYNITRKLSNYVVEKSQVQTLNAYHS
jgi:hypothetical protein